MRYAFIARSQKELNLRNMFFIVTKKLAIVILLLTLLTIMRSDGWKQNTNNWTGDPYLDLLFKYGVENNPRKCNSFDEECGDEFEKQDNFISKRKGSDDLASFSSLSALQNWETKPQRTIPYFHSENQMLCSCGLEYRLMDLGFNFYPRYLPTAVCRPEGCMGPFRCRQRQYKVRVLRKREVGEAIDQSDASLAPENLRDNWIGQTVTVIVACECSP